MKTKLYQQLAPLCLGIILSSLGGPILILLVWSISLVHDYNIEYISLIHDSRGALVRSQRNGKVKSISGNPLAERPPHTALSVNLDPQPAKDHIARRPWSRNVRFYCDITGTIWYALLPDTDAGRMYFTGYSTQTCNIIGYLGINGFSPTPPAVDDQFFLHPEQNEFSSVAPNSKVSHSNNLEYIVSLAIPGEGNTEDIDLTHPLLLTRKKELYLINFQSRTVQKQLPDLPVVDLAENYFSLIPQFEYNYNPTIDIRTESGELLALVNDSDSVGSIKILQKIELPPELSDKRIGWYHFPDKSGLVCARGEFDVEHGLASWLIYHHDSSGILSPAEKIHFREFDYELGFGLGGAILPLWGIEFDSPFSTSESPHISPNSRVWYLAPLGGALCAIAMLLHSRRYQATLFQQVGWSLLGFLGGIPSLIGYFLHRKWPLWISCPNCGKQVPLIQACCTECRKPFPPPAPNGLEILA